MVALIKLMRSAMVAGLWVMTQPSCAEPQIITKTEVYFSPGEGAQDAILSVLARAQTEILVQAYSFTNRQLAQAIVDAKMRGVRVTVILDKSQVIQRHSVADFLADQGVATYIDSTHAIAHNKVMVIDRGIVITGSYNFTQAAENANAENLLILSSNELTDSYRFNWERHFVHSRAYNIIASKQQKNY